MVMDKKRHSLIPVGSVLASGASAAVAVFTLILRNVSIYQSDLEIQSMFNFTSDDSS